MDDEEIMESRLPKSVSVVTAPTNRGLFLGGTHPEIRTQYQDSALTVTRGFTGCIQNFYFDNQLVQFWDFKLITGGTTIHYLSILLFLSELWASVSLFPTEIIIWASVLNTTSMTLYPFRLISYTQTQWVALEWTSMILFLEWLRTRVLHTNM